MDATNLFHGPNAAYVLELYDRYCLNPAGVDAASRAFFEAYTLETDNKAGPRCKTERIVPWTHFENITTQVQAAATAAHLACLIRQRGHLIANLDPLGLSPTKYSRIELEDHGLTPDTLTALPSSVVVGPPLAEQTANALEAISRLLRIYTGSIGYDFEHVQNDEERCWLRQAADSERYFQGFDAQTRRELLQRLAEVNAFEQSIHKRLPTDKRFSIEGTDMLVPMLNAIIQRAALAGTKEVILGMAHRGRLNVLAHVFDQSCASLFSKFSASVSAPCTASDAGGCTGDVKYHSGARRHYGCFNGKEILVTLCPNPSHLEFVGPVVQGRARAAWDAHIKVVPTQGVKAIHTILVHGDAAFPGQGVVAETLNMSRLPGYTTVGSIHIISNNQIGFTTLPSECRSTQYASDLAKGFDVPVVHVNADDPIACIAAAHMAHDFRVQYGKDFLIDLIGYRRYGHNEAEEPELTQPKIYAQVSRHPRVVDIWAQTLIREGVVTSVESQQVQAEASARMDKAWNASSQAGTHLETSVPASLPGPPCTETGVAAERLHAYNNALYVLPAGFIPNEKLNRRTLQGRREGLQKEDGILWGHAEALAFASILADGTPIRLTGEDTERGTFSHRHIVLHDINTAVRFVGLQALPQASASFAIYNSPLSEQSALGFEYGYSVQAPETLVLWEAQFGDFVNGAQIIIDQFLAAGRSKWNERCGMILLLPHGYEGMGPDHSSARLERFLQLASADNLRVANCTTPAQYFHLLRRQAAVLKTDPRPLVLMTPKSMLRASVAASSLADLTMGTFQAVINDKRALADAEQVNRIILCNGKVYFDLIYQGSANKDLRPQWEQTKHVAAIRIEELYPFPEHELLSVIASYPNLREIVWLQEEPQNMGAWFYVAPLIRDSLHWTGNLVYSGRSSSASAAEGNKHWHAAEQAHIIESVLQFCCGS